MKIKEDVNSKSLIDQESKKHSIANSRKSPKNNDVVESFLKGWKRINHINNSVRRRRKKK